MLRNSRRAALRGGATVAAALTLFVLLPACQGLGFAVANLPARIGKFDRQAGLRYGDGPRALLDVYVPRGAQRRPVVVFWYGGSWQKGSRENYRFVGAALAQAGYVAVLPDYRLYPEIRFPEFNRDAARALIWAHDHAEQYGGDPRRIFVMGHSAGAHVAASIAYDGHYLREAGGDPRWIRGFIGLSGPYHLAPNTPELNAIFAAPFAAKDWQLQGFIDRASPPSLLVHGGADDLVWPANSEEIGKLLRENGVSATLRIIPGRGHTDTVAALSAPARRRAPVLQYVREFIDASAAQPAAGRVQN